MLDELVRSGAVAVAMGCDIGLNYPLWVAAKRLGVGLPAFPGTLRGIYVGAASLWVSLAPTVMIEDTVSRVLQESLMPIDSGASAIPKELVCSAASGAVAACVVASPVEHIITRSHAMKRGIGETVKLLYHRHGAIYLAAPPGMAAMAGREVPFAASLFWLQPTLSKMAQALDGNDQSHSIGKYLLVGIATSIIATPISHVPSVIAAYQQGHGKDLRTAVGDLYRIGGVREFWRGLGARTVSLAGTMTVVPLVLRALAPQHANH